MRSGADASGRRSPISKSGGASWPPAPPKRTDVWRQRIGVDQQDQRSRNRSDKPWLKSLPAEAFEDSTDEAIATAGLIGEIIAKSLSEASDIERYRSWPASRESDE